METYVPVFLHACMHVCIWCVCAISYSCTSLFAIDLHVLILWHATLLHLLLEYNRLWCFISLSLHLPSRISFFLFLSVSFSPPPRMCVYDTLFLNVRVQESGIIHNKDQVWACQKIYLEQLLPVRKQESGITEVGAAACFQREKKKTQKVPRSHWIVK